METQSVDSFEEEMDLFLHAMSPNCFICGGTHTVRDCPKGKHMSVDDKKKLVRSELKKIRKKKELEKRQQRQGNNKYSSGNRQEKFSRQHNQKHNQKRFSQSYNRTSGNRLQNVFKQPTSGHRPKNAYTQQQDSRNFRLAEMSLSDPDSDTEADHYRHSVFSEASERRYMGCS